MKKIRHLIFLSVLVYTGMLFSGCEKQESKSDLFPLNVGNEFYYNYSKRDMIASTQGAETWKVISETTQGETIKYIIERNLNAILTIGVNRTTISDSKTYLEVTEDKSTAKITIWDFQFNRYQTIPQIELKKEGYTSMPTITCVFKADSGMTMYTYHHPPNQISDIILSLDSLKTIQ